jgi:hypothetical protein
MAMTKELRAKASDSLHDWFEKISDRDELPKSFHVRRAYQLYRKHYETLEQLESGEAP